VKTTLIAAAIAATLAASAAPAQSLGYDSDLTSDAQPAEPAKIKMPWYGQKTEFVYWAAATADMLTSLDIKHHPALMETNPLLGEHPSDAKIIGYFAATDVLHLLITRELVGEGVPEPIIATWQVLTIGMEGAYAAHNFKIGLRFSF
jgi:hypothetical protein